MSDIFEIHGWREDKAIFEVELLLKSWVDCEDVHGISSIFKTQPYNDFSYGCQFTLSFVLILGEDVFYHPYLEDQDEYYVEMEFNSCSKKFYEGELLKNFNQKDWENV